MGIDHEIIAVADVGQITKKIEELGLDDWQLDQLRCLMFEARGGNDEHLPRGLSPEIAKLADPNSVASIHYDGDRGWHSLSWVLERHLPKGFGDWVLFGEVVLGDSVQVAEGIRWNARNKCQEISEMFNDISTDQILEVFDYDAYAKTFFLGKVQESKEQDFLEGLGNTISRLRSFYSEVVSADLETISYLW